MPTGTAPKKKEINAWVASIGVSLLLLLLLAMMWYIIGNRYQPSVNQVSNEDELAQTIAAYQEKFFSLSPSQSITVIPTGIFIQSFEFISAQTVQVSGYVWQKILKSDLQNGITPGVTFPESKTGSSMQLAYEFDYDKFKLIGWHFYGVLLLQNFNYSRYPFDIQSIWIRMWPKDFFKHVLLVPDFASYKSTKPGEIFGLEEDIVKHGFEFLESYFDMPVMHYDTNFGFSSLLAQRNSLELYFNIIVKRELLNAFIVHLLPIVAIWCILFALTMIITDDKQMAFRVGLSTTQVFIALGGTIFSVILMNAGLRTTYTDQPVLYLEFFYLITYIVIMLVSYDAYMITTRHQIPQALRRNLLPKTLFWPVILASIVIITAVEFFIFPDDITHWHHGANLK